MDDLHQSLVVLSHVGGTLSRASPFIHPYALTNLRNRVALKIALFCKSTLAD